VNWLKRYWYSIYPPRPLPEPPPPPKPTVQKYTLSVDYTNKLVVVEASIDNHPGALLITRYTAEQAHAHANNLRLMADSLDKLAPPEDAK
jgi:hypothetical protein